MKTEKTAAPAADRGKIIVRTSIIGIAANLLLAGTKAFVGVLTNSIAVILDAVNNVSDALSSVITIVGAKLAGRKPDKNHPLGHGRIEYLSAMIVSAIVLYAGVTSLVESVKKIFSAEEVRYGTVSLLLLAFGILVKLILGRYVKSVGKRVNSASLTNSGSDALFDAILSSSVLLSAILYLLFSIRIEAYVGVLLSLFIIRSGIGMMKETTDEIIGKRSDRDVVEKIIETVSREEAVSGVYDIILHSYGPEYTIGSLHVEIPDVMNAEEIDALERRIAQAVYRENGVLLTGIGIYAKNTVDDEIKTMRSDVIRRIASHEGVIQTHGFYVDREKREVSIDVILDFAVDRPRVYSAICRELQEAYPEYRWQITMDLDV